MACGTKAGSLCFNKIYSNCVMYEGLLPEDSPLLREDCVSVEDVIEELLKNIKSLKKELDEIPVIDLPSDDENSGGGSSTGNGSGSSLTPGPGSGSGSGSSWTQAPGGGSGVSNESNPNSLGGVIKKEVENALSQYIAEKEKELKNSLQQQLDRNVQLIKEDIQRDAQVSREILQQDAQVYRSVLQKDSESLKEEINVKAN